MILNYYLRIFSVVLCKYTFAYAILRAVAEWGRRSALKIPRCDTLWVQVPLAPHNLDYIRHNLSCADLSFKD
jgi:hypothetical protein